MRTFNKIIFVLSVIATFITWIGGILLIGDIRHTLLEPQVVGWGGLYLNLFKYLALPLSIAVAAYTTTTNDNVASSLMSYLGVVIVGFFLTFPITLLWLVIMAIFGFVGFVIQFVISYGAMGLAAILIIILAILLGISLL